MKKVNSQAMSLLQAYLHNPKTQRILNSKSGENGFSLIELVVVVAVLAILSAVAIPSFTSINKKARASAATNTIATVAKECATKYANGEASPTFAAVTLDGYASFQFASSNTNCSETGSLVATSSAPTTTVPTFTYNASTGAKTCSWGTSSDKSSDASAVGCKNWSSSNQEGTW